MVITSPSGLGIGMFTFFGLVLKRRPGSYSFHRQSQEDGIMGRFADSTIVLCLLAVFLSGCATTTSKNQARINEAEPECYNKSDCEAKWSAATDWVLHHIKPRIHIYSDELIMTEEPPPDSPLLACIVRKHSTLQPGVYTITADMWCNDILSCDSSIKYARANFNKFVNSVVAKNKPNNVEAAKTENFEKPKAGVKAGIINGKVVVKDVTPGSPAQKAGLKASDVILTFDNIPVKDTASLASMSQDVQFGATKQIRVQRGKEILDLSISYPTIEEMKSNIPQSEISDTKAK
jgi:hypothetical protein